MTPLFLAAQKGHQDVVALLLERGAAMNPIRQDEVTPIFIAAQEGQREVVALLLKNGADANTRAGIGEVMLLHVAAYRGNQELITLLLQHGANKHARMTSGERPIDLAQAQGHSALIPLLNHDVHLAVFDPPNNMVCPSHHFPEFRIDGACWTQMAFHQYDRPNRHRP